MSHANILVNKPLNIKTMCILVLCTLFVWYRTRLLVELTSLTKRYNNLVKIIYIRTYIHIHIYIQAYLCTYMHLRIHIDYPYMYIYTFIIYTFEKNIWFVFIVNIVLKIMIATFEL